MDYIASFWKLTYDPSGVPLVLLDYGQYIDQELAISLAKACEVVNPVDSKLAFIRDGLTSTFAATVKTYTTETLDLTARVNAMHSLIAVSALVKKPLRVEIQGHTGHYWQFSSAFVKTHVPLRELQAAVARWSRAWDILATGLSYT